MAAFMEHISGPWESHLQDVAKRFNQEYEGKGFDLPEEVEAMPLFRDWSGGGLTQRITSPFWEIAKPKKQQHCLDIGCGFSFLIYPWRDWNAFFYGHEISRIAHQILNQRGPQLNSKLFKGVKLAPADKLEYPKESFDLVIATGVSCYYPQEYWDQVLTRVKPLLKPGGFFVFDVVDPEQDIAEGWAILEMYLGAEVFLESIASWKGLIKKAGAKVVRQESGELFHMYKIRW